MVPTKSKSSSLSNHSSCSQSLRHTLWSDQSCSTNSSLLRVGTSPGTMIHPQPLRGMRSVLLQLRSPSPEQQGSMAGQKGSQTTLEEADDLLTQSSMHPTRCPSRVSHMSGEPASSPSWSKSHNRGDSRSETSCSRRIGQDPSSSSCVTYHRQRLPALTHTSPHYTPAGTPGSPVTDERACDDQTMATRGSTTRPSSPTTEPTHDDASLPLSPELPSEIDPQELLDFLHEFEQDRRRSKTAPKTGPGPQRPVTHCDNSAYPRPSDGTEGQTHRNGLGAWASTTSDMAQPPPVRNPPGKGTTSPDEPNASIPSLVVNPPDSPPALARAETRYRPPEPFVGRFASSAWQAPARTLKKRRKSSSRPDIRALPNYDDDPIDEGA
ncbi:hypothetical protein E4U41_001998 [Claviceps citrina]|nr:hypothetical protein E4U41_001998 [Claviceps citrina]